MENLETIKNTAFWPDKTVLVTGHEGFLGSWLSKTLIASGAKVIGLDKVKDRPRSILTKNLRKHIFGIKGNVSNFALVEKIINRHRPSIIFHLAAEAIVGQANRYPLRAFKSNIEGTWNILEAARGKEFIKAIVAASSDKAYGSLNELPYKEDSPLKGSHPYDASKSCADLLCYTYYNTYKVPVCVTRCGNIYGPGDFHFSRIVPDTIRSAINNKILTIRSDGKFTRDYIYVKDIVSAYITLAEAMNRRGIAGEAFNFSNEKPISVLKLVKTIYTLAGKRPFYTISNSAQHEIRDQYLSSRKAKRYLKWHSEYSLREGLERTINWYRTYFDES